MKIRKFDLMVKLFKFNLTQSVLIIIQNQGKPMQTKKPHRSGTVLKCMSNYQLILTWLTCLRFSKIKT